MNISKKPKTNSSTGAKNKIKTIGREKFLDFIIDGNSLRSRDLSYASCVLPLGNKQKQNTGEKKKKKHTAEILRVLSWDHGPASASPGNFLETQIQHIHRPQPVKTLWVGPRICGLPSSPGDFHTY